MKNIVIFMFLISGLSYSQSKEDQKFIRNYHKYTPDSWIYFTAKDTITGTILNHTPANSHCGTVATTSITIVITQKNDTIRVLDLCNTSNDYKINQKIKVAPKKKPEFKVSFPFEFTKNKKTKKIELVPKYDLILLETIWGKLVH